jgi:hypothetical protein
VSRKGRSIHYVGVIAILGAALFALLGSPQSPRALAMADLDLYTDSLATGWQSEVSGAAAVFDNSSPVHDGAASLAVTHMADKGALYLKASQPLAWDAYEVIRFWVHGGPSGGQQIRLRLVGAPPYNHPYESVGYALPPLAADTWTHYEINLAELGTTTYDIARIKFEDASGGAQPTYYLDGIQLGFATQQPPPAPSGALTIAIDTSADRHAISPYIYGSNMDFRDIDRLPARRLGGNRTTGYNWENNASNAGQDSAHISDAFMCWARKISIEVCDSTPGVAYTKFHDQSLDQDAYSLLTLQMAGYAAKDKNGVVEESQTAPSSRWVPVVAAKGAPFATDPDQADGAIYMDELVNFLVQQYGAAASPSGVRGYSLDNEPALWPSTHPRIHTAQLTYTELVSRSIALARAVKAVDSSAEVFGPAAYGFEEFRTLQNAPDRAAEQRPGEDWFIDYYLDRLREAEPAAGGRLLDVLDVHWYPEARGGNRRIVTGHVGKGDTAVQRARMQAPRTLWDPTYHEDSWIAANFSDFLPLLPRLKASIDDHYRDTKLAFTEFDYGGDQHISGGIATADVLGIFGRYGVYMADFWNEDADYDPTYTAAAYKLYRNYDGNHSAFEDTHVYATTSDVEKSSVYASVNQDGSELHIILLNKTFDQTLSGTFNIAGDKQYANGSVWGFNQYTSRIFQAAPINTISGNSFQYAVPPLTAYHIVLRTDPPPPTRTPSATKTPTTTRTPTATRTPAPTSTPTVTPTPGPTRIPQPDTCDVHYSKDNEWEGGFLASITIANTGTDAIDDWTLNWSFADEQAITSLWNATYIQDGAAVMAHHASWNGTIAAGSTVTIGFLADRNEVNTNPTSFTLNGMTCTVSP